MVRRELLRIVTVVLACASLFVATPLFAEASTYGGGSVSGYAADEPLDYGRIVTLEGKNANKVKPATQSDVQNMFGVTVDPQQVPLTISHEGVQNETYVAVSGTYNVL